MNLEYPTDLFAGTALIIAGLHYAHLGWPAYLTLTSGFALLVLSIVPQNIAAMISLIRSK